MQSVVGEEGNRKAWLYNIFISTEENQKESTEVLTWSKADNSMTDKRIDSQVDHVFSLSIDKHKSLFVKTHSRSRRR